MSDERCELDHNYSPPENRLALLTSSRCGHVSTWRASFRKKKTFRNFSNLIWIVSRNSFVYFPCCCAFICTVVQFQQLFRNFSTFFRVCSILKRTRAASSEAKNILIFFLARNITCWLRAFVCGHFWTEKFNYGWVASRYGFGWWFNYEKNMGKYFWTWNW